MLLVVTCKFQSVLTLFLVALVTLVLIAPFQKFVHAFSDKTIKQTCFVTILLALALILSEFD